MSTSNRPDAPFDLDVSAWGALPRRRGLFVTGTDTEVGKTLVAGAIARSLRRRGRRVEVFKPVASGCRRAGGQLVSEDAEFLAACADSQRCLAEITPVRYAAPLAPNVAARREGRPVDLNAVFDAYARLADSPSPVIVEGVGGLLCPITDDFWVIHLARLMALPLVVVARAGLGTIHHTLLTLHAARSAGLSVAGVVVNGYRVEVGLADDLAPGRGGGGGVAGDLAMATNPQQIAERGNVAVLALVPWDPRCSVAEGRIGQGAQHAVDQVDWEELMGGSGE